MFAEFRVQEETSALCFIYVNLSETLPRAGHKILAQMKLQNIIRNKKMFYYFIVSWHEKAGWKKENNILELHFHANWW